MKKINTLLKFVVISLILLSMAACSQPAALESPDTSAGDSLSGTINLAGSTTIQPLAELLAETFMDDNPGVQITVQGGGSSVGVKSAAEATVDIGMASREVKQEELNEFPQLVVHVIAQDGIAAVAHSEVPVTDLTLEQVRSIFSGEISNWDQVGGPDQIIIVVSREEGSGTRDAFQELVMGKEAMISENAILQSSNGAVRTTVATTPFSIGYLSFGYLDDSIKVLSVNGVEANEINVSNGTYPVVRPLNMLTNGEPEGSSKAFLDFILSDAGQTLVVSEGYLSVK